MGNQQSNERQRNWKIFKVTRVDGHSNWVRCHLDDCVPYSDGEFARMDFEKDSNAYAFMRLVATAGTGQDPVSWRPYLIEKDDYLAIDIDLTRNHSSSTNFDKGFVRKIGRETVDGNGSNIIEAAGGWCQAIVDSRVARAERIQQLRFQRQMEAWHLEPPKK